MSHAYGTETNAIFHCANISNSEEFQTAASYQTIEATEEEIEAAKRPPKARRPKRTAAKAAPAPPAAVANSSASAAPKVAQPKPKADAPLDTPMKDGKRCAKPSVPGPEDTPEVQVTPSKQLQKRQRGKHADPNPEAQVESLKEAPHHATPTCL